MIARNRRTAMALLLVLWAVSILALLAGGLTFVIRQELAIAGLQKDRITAHALARAGVERAIAAMMDDLATVDTLDDEWCDDPLAFQDVELAGGTFSVMHGSSEPAPEVWYGVDDESAKLNLSTATEKQLLALPDMTEPVAAAIVDWRDRDDDPQPQGTEGSYYAALPHPYQIRNGPMRTVHELLLVSGATPELFFGEDLNGNGLLDPNEDDGPPTLPADNQDGRLDRGWLAYVTVYSYEKNLDSAGQKRLNINSADATTLAQRLSLENWAAKSVVKAREQKKFEHLVDLLDVKRDASEGSSSNEGDINTRSSDEKNQPVTTNIFKRIADLITLSDEEVLPGRINVNTAPREVIETLPDVDRELADAIVRHRSTGGGYASIAELLDVSGMSKEKFAGLENNVTVRSWVFRIRSEGRATSDLARATIECVVDRGGSVPRILYWRESSP